MNDISIALKNRTFIGYTFEGTEFMNAYVKYYIKYTHGYLNYSDIEDYKQLRESFQKEGKIELSLSKDAAIIIQKKRNSDEVINKFNL